MISQKTLRLQRRACQADDDRCDRLCLCRWQVSEHDEVEIRDPEENEESAIGSKNLNGCSLLSYIPNVQTHAGSVCRTSTLSRYGQSYSNQAAFIFVCCPNSLCNHWKIAFASMMVVSRWNGLSGLTPKLRVTVRSNAAFEGPITRSHLQ
jgi:hypothetical protein